MAVFLRQEVVIETFLRNKNLYLLKILQLMMEYSTSETLVKHGVAVLRQICCKKETTYDLINGQLDIQHIKMFLRTKILLCHADTEIQEQALVCIMQLSTRGRALETKQCDLRLVWQDTNAEVRSRLDELVTNLEELYEVGSAANQPPRSQPQTLSTKLLTIYQYFSDDARISTYLNLLNVDESCKNQSTHE